MSDRNARNGKDRMHVLVDDLSCYGLLTAEETEVVIQEVEGYSVFPNPARFTQNHFLL